MRTPLLFYVRFPFLVSWLIPSKTQSIMELSAYTDAGFFWILPHTKAEPQGEN